MDMGGGETPYTAFVDTPQPQRALPPSAAANRRARNSCWRALCACLSCDRTPQHRLIRLNAGRPTTRRYAANAVKNTKYSPITFLPKLLFEQFRYFFNLYYLVVALSQLFPPLQIGLLFTYIAPLVFVLAVTMAKEAYDDIQRWRTDVSINHESYERLLPTGATTRVRAQDIEVGHVIRVSTDQRVPADLVMLRTHDQSGTAFVRTDQLDGETDWKLRLAVPSCQKLAGGDAALATAVLTLHAAPPSKDIYDFQGDVTLCTSRCHQSRCCPCYGLPPCRHCVCHHRTCRLPPAATAVLLTIPRSAPSQRRRRDLRQRVHYRATRPREHAVGEHCPCFGHRLRYRRTHRP